MSDEQGYLFLDEAEEIPPPLIHKRRFKMSSDTQQCLIICFSVVALLGVILFGTYHIRKGNKEIILLMMDKGYVKCVDVDGVTRLSPPERCKR